MTLVRVAETHALFFEMKFFLRRTHLAGYKTDVDDETAF